MVDRRVLNLVLSNKLYPADFVLRADGVCGLNPQMAKHIISAVVFNPLLGQDLRIPDILNQSLKPNEQ
jgi:hypothetical protein